MIYFKVLRLPLALSVLSILSLGKINLFERSLIDLLKYVHVSFNSSEESADFASFIID